MKKFMLLHFGFEPPTPEIMAAWGKWFESVADKTADQGAHFVGGREISHSGKTFRWERTPSPATPSSTRRVLTMPKR